MSKRIDPRPLRVVVQRGRGIGRDLERSKQWGDMPAIEFETDSLTIAIMQSDAFGQTFQSHSLPIALHVADVEEARRELEAKGVEFGGDTMDSGVCHMAHFKDPDGNTLMFHNRYAPQPD